MARDDDFEDDDLPRRRRPRDDEDDDDRPPRSRRRYDEDDDRPPPKKRGAGVIIGVLVGVFVLCCGGGGLIGYYLVRGVKKGLDQVGEAVQGVNESQQNLQNLSQIGSAAHKYHDKVGEFPNNSYETGGKQSRA